MKRIGLTAVVGILGALLLFSPAFFANDVSTDSAGSKSAGVVTPERAAAPRSEAPQPAIGPVTEEATYVHNGFGVAPEPCPFETLQVCEHDNCGLSIIPGHCTVAPSQDYVWTEDTGLNECVKADGLLDCPGTKTVHVVHIPCWCPNCADPQGGYGAYCGTSGDQCQRGEPPTEDTDWEVHLECRD